VHPVYSFGELLVLPIGNGLDETVLAILHPLFAQVPSLLQ